MTDSKHRHRIGFFAGLALLVMGGLCARLVFLQLHLGAYNDREDNIINKRRMERNLQGGRGGILDRNGNLLALDIARQGVHADPAEIVRSNQVDRVASDMGRILNLDAASLKIRLNNPASRFVNLGGYGVTVDEEKASEIRQLGLPGVTLSDVMTRSYPMNQSMCHVLGYVNLQGEGSAGIEQRMDRYLRGLSGLVVSEVDGHRRELVEKRTIEIKAHNGASVMLTLDQYVQYMAERALERAVEEQKAIAGWTIVQRVKTGEILAMASLPAFDPNDFRGIADDSRRNRCIANVYEPGSTFKVAIISAALNEGLVTPNQIFDCENGMWMYQRRPLHDFHSYGLLSVADIIKKSSNIGAAKIAVILGNERVYNYLKAFGIGQSAGIELPGEESGILHSLPHWSGISVTRIAIGHEVGVTALQMMGVVSAIANGGVLMRPYVIKEVRNAMGELQFQQSPRELSRPITPKTAATMRELLVRVTEEGGTGHKARVEGYTVGGKTGTAQKPVPGGYSDSRNMASFVGFIPAESPELAMIVVLDEPKQDHTGGASAAPVFKEIAEQCVRYLDIPPPDGGAVAGANRGFHGDRIELSRSMR